MSGDVASVDIRYTYEQLYRWAFEDELTGLSNRRHLVEQIKAREERGVPSLFITIDLDGFKAAQDAHPDGHAYGDRVLRCFADFLRRITRSTLQRGATIERVGIELHQHPTYVRREPDIVAFRPGGDEFVVIVDDVRGVERLSREIVAWSLDGIRASVGVGTSLAEADKRLYDMKQTVRAAVASTETR